MFQVLEVFNIPHWYKKAIGTSLKITLSESDRVQYLLRDWVWGVPTNVQARPPILSTAFNI